MKKVLLATAVALVCSGAFAQTTPDPARGNTVTGPGTPSTTDKAAVAGQAKADARKAANPNAGTEPMKPVPNEGTPSTTDRASVAGQAKADAKKSRTEMTPMDANGDGKITKREYDRYHSAMWSSMKGTSGTVSQTEMQNRMANNRP